MTMVADGPSLARACSFSSASSTALPLGCSFLPFLPALVSSRRRRSLRCFASSSDHQESPPLLKSAISGLTELLRTLSPKKKRDDTGLDEAPLASSVDDVLRILDEDYSRAYFLTGNFTSDIYAKDCLFEDPTIKFIGKDQYSQNLDLLVPFYDCPSLVLQKIEKGCNNGTNCIIAKWKLRSQYQCIIQQKQNPEGNRMPKAAGNPSAKIAWISITRTGQITCNNWLSKQAEIQQPRTKVTLQQISSR